MLMPVAFISAHFLEQHVRFVVRTRVMCQAGRARAAGARGDIVAWLCERAPLWVVVHGFDLCHKYILYFVFCILYFARVRAAACILECLPSFVSTAGILEVV